MSDDLDCVQTIRDRYGECNHYFPYFSAKGIPETTPRHSRQPRIHEEYMRAAFGAAPISRAMRQPVGQRGGVIASTGS